MIASLLRRAPAIVMTLLLTACADAPSVHFYTLEVPAYPAARSPDTGGLTVSLGPLSVPEMVDRQELVLRVDENRVEVVDLSRWAQPLKSQLGSALAANLARELDTLRVFQAGQGLSSEPDIRVAVDFLRFDSAPGAEVVEEVRWLIRRQANGDPLAGHALIRETASSAAPEALVAAHDRALAKIAHEIAAAIRAARSQQVAHPLR